jgi:ABC-type sugar transport system substrate-binding protein
MGLHAGGLEGVGLKKRVYVLLVGSREAAAADHYQLLQEQAAVTEGAALGLEVEVAWAAAFDQFRIVRRRAAESARPVDAIVSEPANLATIEFLLRELRGKTGLVLLNAWDPVVERYLHEWGTAFPVGTVSTPHMRIGEIQGRQLSALVPQGGRALAVTGPAGSNAAQERLQGLRATLRADITLHDTHAGEWTEDDGQAAFKSWYGIFKSRRDEIHAIAAQSDELAMGARSASRAVADAQHAAMFQRAKLLGVDACPGYGRELVDRGTLQASITTPANTSLALTLLQRFWTKGQQLPPQSFTEVAPYPAGSVAR